MYNAVKPHPNCFVQTNQEGVKYFFTALNIFECSKMYHHVINATKQPGNKDVCITSGHGELLLLPLQFTYPCV